MTAGTNTERSLITAVLVLVPLVYWTGLKDYTLGPKLIVWQIPLIAILADRIRRGLPHPATELLLPATCYALISGLSILWTVDPVISLIELSKIVTGLVLMAVVAAHPPSDPKFVQALVIAATLSAVLGILQHFGAPPFIIPSAGIPSGTLGFRNVAATVTIQAIPFALLLVYRVRNRTFWLVALALLGGFLVQTRSRGAWVGLTCGILAIILLDRERNLIGQWRPLIAACVVAFCLGALPSQVDKLGPQDIDEKKTTVFDTVESVFDAGGDRGRLAMWAGSARMILANPLGVGLSNWALHYPAFDEKQLVTEYGAPSKPHNDLLWIASETGWLGLTSFLWLIIGALRIGMRQIRPDKRELAIACIASLIGLIVHSCFSFPKNRVTPMLFFWMTLGLLGSLSTQQKRLTRPVWSLTLTTMVLGMLLTSRLIRFESWLGSATVSERQDDWTGVAEKTEQALSEGRFHTEAIQLRGYALNTLGRYAESIDHYERYAPFRPHDVQILNGHAIALQNTDELEDAARKYREARALVAASGDLDYNLATLLIRQKRPDEAIEILEALTENQPDAAILFHLGNARILAGRTKEAIAALEQAVTTAPELAQGWMVLGELYLRSKRHQDAKRAFREFLNYHKSQDAYTRRAIEAIEAI
ncbi:MAG TPA: hypothetical protein DHW45_09945, partial [Candidatus Latescibacteria bacterium]|nr:hypothetical protein [Candidatus Latescibacterota bacterium]